MVAGRTASLLVSLLFTLAIGAHAQTTVPTPPAGMTQQQFDALVERISNAVVDRLKKEGVVAPTAVEPAKPEAAAGPEADALANDQATAFVARARLALTAFPELWHNLMRIPDLLDKSASGGRGLIGFLVTLAVAIGAALGSEVLLRRALDGIRTAACDAPDSPVRAPRIFGRWHRLPRRAGCRRCLAGKLWVDWRVVSRLR